MTDDKLTDSESLCSLIRRRFREGQEATAHNRETAREDLKFAYVPGEQWPEKRRKDYESKGRPCLEINRMPSFLGQVVGDQRQTNPSIKIHPVDSQGDPDTAQVIEGLILNIESVSHADVAYDTAFEHTTGGGFGWWRVYTDYLDEQSFDQEILIKAIPNCFSVVFDPLSVSWDRTDAEWCLVHEWMDRKAYEAKYPGKSPSDFEIEDGSEDWITEKAVRVAEYFYKRWHQKTLYLLDDDTIVEKLPEGVKAKKSRTVDAYEIMRVKVDGFNILEEDQLWPSKYWPLVPVEGKSIQIGDMRYVWGLIHYGKDSQRAYNVTRSRETEMYMMAPIAPVVATTKQIGSYKGQWDTAHKETYPYLLYDPDPEAPGAPQRLNPPQISSALANSAGRDIEDMKATIGLFDASLGNRSNETSGVAIQSRQKEGDRGTFQFIDNLARARMLTYKIILDLIPKIYDAKRVVRVLGQDDSVKTVTVNEPGYKEDEQGNTIATILNDLTVGKYDLTMTMGPSYATQRQEAAASMQGFIQVAPQTAPLIGDLFAKNQDWPGAQEVARRLKSLVPPQALTEEERQEIAKDQPQQEPQAPPPDPRLIEMQAKIEMDQVRLSMEMDLHQLEKEKRLAEIENIRSQGIRNVAQAGTQFKFYQAELDQLASNVAHHVALTMANMNKQSPQGGQVQPATPANQAPEMPQDERLGGGQGLGQGQNIPSIQARAEGGPVNPNQPYLVGEQGPEVIVPQQAGVVIPNVNFAAPVTLPPEQEQKFQEWIKQTPWHQEFVQRYGESPDLNDQSYNYRRAWLSGATPVERNKVDGQYHWPDATPSGETLKSSSHPSVWMNPFMQQYGINPDDLAPDDTRVIEFKNAWNKKYSK